MDVQVYYHLLVITPQGSSGMHNYFVSGQAEKGIKDMIRGIQDFKTGSYSPLIVDCLSLFHTDDIPILRGVFFSVNQEVDDTELGVQPLEVVQVY